MSYKIMKTEWYKLNINDEKIIYRKIVDGLFYPLTMKEKLSGYTDNIKRQNC